MQTKALSHIFAPFTLSLDAGTEDALNKKKMKKRKFKKGAQRWIKTNGQVT